MHEFFNGLMVALLPIVITIISGVIKDGKIRIKECLVVTGISCAFTLLFWLIAKSCVTVFELLLCSSSCAAGVALFMIPLIKHKIITQDMILRTLCVESILVASYSILTYGQTNVHSDTATATLLANCIVKNKNLFPLSWNYANGDIWVFGTHLTTLIPSQFIADQSLARMIGSLSWVLIAMLSVVILSKSLFKSDCWQIIIPILLVFLFEMGDMMLYQAAYIGQVIWMSACAVLLNRIMWSNEHKEKNYLYLIVYCILIVCTVAAGARMLAEQIVPSLIALIVLTYVDAKKRGSIDWKTDLTRITKYGCVIGIPSIVGLVIYALLCKTHNVNYTVNSATVFCDSLQACWDNLTKTLLAFLECFGYHESAELISVHGLQNLISIVMCGLICIAVPIFQAKRIKEENTAVQYFFAFYIIHNAIMLILAVFFGKNESRYLLTSVILSILVSSRYIYEYWILSIDLRKYVWIALFVLATSIELIGMGMLSRKWSEKVTEKKTFCAELSQFGIYKGYATYWNAYTNEIYSDNKLKFGAVNFDGDNIEPFRWLVDNDVFIPGNNSSFLLLSNEENEMFSQYIEEKLGKPERSEQFSELYVYYFNYDIAKYFGKTIKDGVVRPKELFVSNGFGFVEEDAATVLPGGIQFGPYKDIEAGKYIIRYQGTNLGQVDWRITKNDGQEVIEGKELNRTNEEITVEVNFDIDSKRVEFTAFNSGDSDVVITGILVNVEGEE